MAICDDCRCSTPIKIDGYRMAKGRRLKVGRCKRCHDRAVKPRFKPTQWRLPEVPEAFR